MRLICIFFMAMASLLCHAQQPVIFQKMSPGLLQIHQQAFGSVNFKIILSLKNDSAFQYWKGKLNTLQSYPRNHVLLCAVKDDELLQLIKDSAVLFAEMLRKPKEELTTGSLDISLNKLNLVHSLYPEINGNRIYASLKEQRFDTTDIDLKGRYFNSGIEAPAQSSHASIMATMMGGGGNSSPFARGAAEGIHLSSSDFANLFPDQNTFYQQFHISVQNHSYGTGIENYYGADAAAYDDNVFNNSVLVHVFSSGNSGTESPADGNYAGIAGVANLTGSFKMAKNILTVGSVDSFNTVVPLSSRGPAYDGRVKPELVAFGYDGSSGAAALVSGAAALLQDAYLRDAGHLPSAALIKAVLLNGADKVKGSTLNYTSGYGSLNVYSAINTIKAKQYSEGVVQKNGTKTIALNVPDNIATLKITVAWTDPPAAVNASKALVNDLDAKLVLPSTHESWLPWVLNSTPHPDSLQLTAVRKTDTLNNVEQITIDHPAAGDYLIEINGDKLITADQQYAMSFLLDTVGNFSWTYPSGSAVLQAAHEHLLRWQSNIASVGRIEYSLGNGPWQLVNDGVNLEDQLAQCTLPDTTAVAKLRITVPSIHLTKETAPFAISASTDVQVVFNCQDSFMLQWNGISGKPYQVYHLGDKYLEPIATSSKSYIVFKKQLYPSLYYCVAPVIEDQTGLRSATINYTDQGTDCYFHSFYATLENENSTRLELTLGGIYGLRQISFQKKINNDYRTIYSVTNPFVPYATFADTQLIKGVNTYRAALSLQNGSIIYSSEQSDFYFPNDPVIIFPNPVRQHQPLRIIAREPGAYSIHIYDAMGKSFYGGMLTDIDQQINIAFPRGVYLIKIYSGSGKGFTRKLVVY